MSRYRRTPGRPCYDDDRTRTEFDLIQVSHSCMIIVIGIAEDPWHKVPVGVNGCLKGKRHAGDHHLRFLFIHSLPLSLFTMHRSSPRLTLLALLATGSCALAAAINPLFAPAGSKSVIVQVRSDLIILSPCS
jgi:hypothetical protein